MLTKIGHRVVIVPVLGITVLLGYMLAMAALYRVEVLDALSVYVSAAVITVLALLDLSRIKWFEVQDNTLHFHSLFQSSAIPLSTLQFRTHKNVWSALAIFLSYFGKGWYVHDYEVVQLQIGTDRWCALAIISSQLGDGLVLWRGEFLTLLGLQSHIVHAERIKSYQQLEQLRQARAYRSLSWGLVIALCALVLMYYFPDESMRVLSKITQWLPDRPHRGGVQYYEIPQ